MVYDTCLVMKIFTIGLPAECDVCIPKKFLKINFCLKLPHMEQSPSVPYSICKEDF